VALNKIDTLWDTLSSGDQVQAQLQRQRATVCEMLEMPPERVLAISAQKGLVAKITGDDALLQASGLPVLEDALARGIMGQRQAILREAVATGVAGLRLETERVLNVRRRDLDEQMLELRSLRGKNASVIGAMRARIEQEQREFDASAAKIQAVRSVHLRLLRELFVQLGARAQKEQLTQLSDTLQQRGLKLGRARCTKTPLRVCTPSSIRRSAVPTKSTPCSMAPSASSTPSLVFLCRSRLCRCSRLLCKTCSASNTATCST